ncbi:MAG: tetratricopeptide repeat protein, partial [Trueperaceae bacterium]|nr:tetratricopeptide repeat protein [Trueperaceae bacterium]
VRTPDALARALRAHEPDAGDAGDAPALLFVDDVPHLAWLADVVPGVLERHPTLSLLATGRGPVDDVPAARIPVRGLPVRAPGPDRVGRPDPATDVLLRATRAAGATPPRDLGRDPRVRVAVERSGGHPLTLVHLGALLAREGLEALAPLAPPGACDATSDVADAPGLVEVFRPVVRLLPDEPRATLATLGAFHGPVDRHAIRRVTGLSEARLARDVRTLQGHHLLEHAPGVGAHATVQVAGGVRTWVRCEHERVLAGERDAFEGLDAAAVRGLRDAHAAWIDDVVARAEADALGHDQQRTFARLEALLDDVDAALAHLEAHDRGADALRIAASAWRFHDMANRVPSALERLERLLKAHGGAVDRLVRSDAENARGSLHLKAGALDRARAAYEAGLALREVEGDARRIASSLNNLAVVDGMSNAFADAATKFRQVHDVAREGGEPWVAAAALVNRGHALTEAGRPEEALEAYRAGAGHLRALGDLHGRLGALLGVVHTAAATGADAIVASTVWEWIDAASADGGVRDVGRLALPARVTAEKLRAFGYPDLARRLERELDALSGPTPGDATPEPTYRT